VIREIHSEMGHPGCQQGDSHVGWKVLLPWHARCEPGQSLGNVMHVQEEKPF
jgi:hypothetical protein